VWAPYHYLLGRAPSFLTCGMENSLMHCANNRAAPAGVARHGHRTHIEICSEQHSS
jgi:hypothetical protein